MLPGTTQFVTAGRVALSTDSLGVARRAGVTESDCQKIARAFVYEGFRLPADREP